MKLYQCVPDAGGWDGENMYLFCVSQDNTHTQKTPKYIFERPPETFEIWKLHGYVIKMELK